MNLLKGDCLERMKEIESGSVDAIICDPPYGTVKVFGGGGVSHGMKGKTGWDDALDHDNMLEECNRILRKNGALVLFSQDPYTAKLMTKMHSNLPFSYRYAWKKDHFANALNAKKAPLNYTEDVCVFFKKYDTLGQHPLREYSKAIMQFIGKNLKEINADLGHRRSEHFFYVDSTQFGMCTEKTYNELTELYHLRRLIGFKEFEELEETDKAHKATIARTFNLPEGQKYKSNVLEYKKDYHGLHPTAKPVALMEDLVKTYTNAGDLVMDFTMGSGSTGVGCANTGRDFIGIERDEGYFAIAQERIEKAHKNLAQAEFEKLVEMFD